MRQWIVSAFVQVIAWRLFGAKPLPEPMLPCCQLDSWKKIQWKSNQNSIIFIQENAFEIVVWQSGGHGRVYTFHFRLFLRWYQGFKSEATLYTPYSISPELIGPWEIGMKF